MSAENTRMTVIPKLPESRLNAVDRVILGGWFESLAAGADEGRQLLETRSLDHLAQSVGVALPDDAALRYDINQQIVNRFTPPSGMEVPEWAVQLRWAANNKTTSEIELPVSVADYLQDLITRPDVAEWQPIGVNEFEIRVEHAPHSHQPASLLGQWLVRSDGLITAVEREPVEVEVDEARP